jgi:fructose-bisphosphate aldolase class 1
MHEVKLRKLLMNYAEMLEKVATASGFIAALDQSGGSTPKALRVMVSKRMLTQMRRRCLR